VRVLTQVGTGLALEPIDLLRCAVVHGPGANFQ
jgi:hypothetical protein